jgi:TetR/AcrR family transcriptional regulator, cholesterol catabolism regulator
LSGIHEKDRMDTLETDILKTATELFCKYGLRNVTIDDICAEIRISKKTFYTYFRQKEDLILQMVESMHEKKAEKEKKFVLSADDNKNTIDRAMAIVHLVKSNSEDKMQTLFYELSKYYPNAYAQIIEKQQQQTIDYFTRNIEEGIAEGIFRDNLDVGMTAQFLSTQFRSALDSSKETPKRKFQAVFEFMIDVYIRIVTNEKGLQYYNETYANKQDSKK